MQGLLCKLKGLSKRTLHNEVWVFHEPDKAIEDIWREIDKAKEEVLMITYILKDDDVGRETLGRLEQAAGRGVKVMLLYDSAGNITGRGRLTANLKEAGGDVVCFRSFWGGWARYAWSGGRFLASPVLRNHRKVILIDGRVGYIGGLNIGNEYAGRPCTGPYLTAGKTFRDIMVKVKGPCLVDLREVIQDTLAMQEWQPTPLDRWERPSWQDFMKGLNESTDARYTPAELKQEEAEN
eukprot:gene18254-28138_t